MLSLDLLNDNLVGRLRISLVKHEALVPGPLEHRRERHDADRGKAHDANVAVSGAGLGWQGIKLWISDVDQKNQHSTLLLNIRTMETQQPSNPLALGSIP